MAVVDTGNREIVKAAVASRHIVHSVLMFACSGMKQGFILHCTVGQLLSIWFSDLVQFVVCSS